MARQASPRILVSVGVAFLASGLAGCIPFVPIYYAYPTMTFVPGTNVGAEHEEVHAFRVVIADEISCPEYMKPGSYRLGELPIKASGEVPGQLSMNVDTGFVWNCIALSYDEQTCHTVRIRLYRPGYDLVEITSEDTRGKIKWEKAGSAVRQEKAVDQLLAPTADSTWAQANRDRPDNHWGFDQLDPGSKNQGHRKALVFAAEQYERIAELAGEQMGAQAVATRCKAKAKWLRARAEG